MKTYQEFAIDYYQDEDGMFTARVPAIKGCIAWGKTLEETYRHAVDAIESCLEAREKVAALKLRKPRYAGLNIYSRAVNV
jgi:predicted RNase H-like HicB family nuclease